MARYELRHTFLDRRDVTIVKAVIVKTKAEAMKHFTRPYICTRKVKISVVKVENRQETIIAETTIDNRDTYQVLFTRQVDDDVTPPLIRKFRAYSDRDALLKVLNALGYDIGDGTQFWTASDEDIISEIFKSGNGYNEVYELKNLTKDEVLLSNFEEADDIDIPEV